MNVAERRKEFKEIFEALDHKTPEDLLEHMFNQAFSLDDIFSDNDSHHPDPDHDEKKAQEYVNMVNEHIARIQHSLYSLLTSTRDGFGFYKSVNGVAVGDMDAMRFLESMINLKIDSVRIVHNDGKRNIAPSVQKISGQLTMLELMLTYGRFDSAVMDTVSNYVK